MLPSPEDASDPGSSLAGSDGNSPTVAYVADATPGLMKMASDLVDSHSEAGGGPEAVDTLRPRARPTVWPGRRSVPGIVAPRPRGSTRSRMSPHATSPAAGLRWSVGVGRYGAPKSVPSFRVRHHKSTPPPRTALPPLCLMGDRGSCRAHRRIPPGIFGAVSTLGAPSRKSAAHNKQERKHWRHARSQSAISAL